MQILFLLFLTSCTTWASNNFEKKVTGLRKIPEKLNVGSRIIGGDLARAGQFPWMAAIYKTTTDGRYFCAGTLIAAQWVMTAAQCTYEAIEFVIHLGSNTLQGDDPNRVTLAAEEYIIHQNYNTSTLWTDIALIKFRMPIEFTDYIQPILYANMGYIYPGRKVDTAGWGQTSDSNPSLMNELQWTELTIFSVEECKNYYGDYIFPSTTCAEGNYNEGVCYGDIGGALIAPALVGNHSLAIAIASFISPNGCESVDPTGYVRVDAYNEWITKTMAANT